MSRCLMSVLFLMLTITISITGARAATDCESVPGIAGEVDAFLGYAATAQAAGQGTMPVRKVLFGVTGIDDEDAGQLDARGSVTLTRRTANGGDYTNQGPEKVTIEGIFAGRETLFRLPTKIAGRYRLDPDRVTLTYDPAHAVDVGERVIGIPFFVSVHRMVVTQRQISFYFAGNDSEDPDRCYLVQ